MNGKPELISEAVKIDRGTSDTSAMGRGEPGLPTGFTWRKQHYEIVEVLEVWKESEAEKHRSGERYLRKHFWRVRVDSGEIMTLYALRRMKAGESAKKRWWIYTVER